MEKTDFKSRRRFYAGDTCKEFIFSGLSGESPKLSGMYKFEDRRYHLYSDFLLIATRKLFRIHEWFTDIKRSETLPGILQLEYFKPVWKSIARMPARDYKDDDENYSRIMNLFDTVLKNTGGDEINIILTNDVESDEWRYKKEFQPWNI